MYKCMGGEQTNLPHGKMPDSLWRYFAARKVGHNSPLLKCGLHHNGFLPKSPMWKDEVGNFPVEKLTLPKPSSQGQHQQR
jgi:hypothetical protein